MKKLMAVASATLLFASVAGVSSAHHRDDHTSNYHGMCTAYFSGSEDGQRNKRSNGSAFGAFVETVGDYDGDDDIDDYDVAAFCNDMTGGYGNPGGGNTPVLDGDPNPDGCTNPDGDECSYDGGSGTGSNGGNGNGNNGG